MSFVDEEGNEVDITTWMELSRSTSLGVVVLESTVPRVTGDVIFRTVWTGIVVPECDVRPFATGKAPGPDGPWTTVEQYDRREDAINGHRKHVLALLTFTQ